MGNLHYRTAGESHGAALITLIEGMPSGVEIDSAFVDGELHRRQGGYGRGARQRIESDRARFLAGVRQGVTIGSPIAIEIANADARIDDPQKTPPVHRPRPGHADLAGSIKWLTTDCRSTLERASARETAARTAAGAVAQCLLRVFGIECFGFVRGALATTSTIAPTESALAQLRAARDSSEIYCPDAAASDAIIKSIHQAKVDKDTVGGICEVHVFGVVPGLGSCASVDTRLDARLAMAVMGIQAFKGVEIGLGMEVARRTGSQLHDPIHFDPARTGESHMGFVRPSNNAGGLEGGMTNGMPIVVRGAMKPISTLLRGLPSVDLRTHESTTSQYERSDISAIAAASVVMENMVAFEIARALREKFGGDSLGEMRVNYAGFLTAARTLGAPR
ncbi:MAG: chorismate synthase [Phycisphaerales bacterium]|nr:chorismate synthase [Phycisphaerales bacterium]